MPASFGDYVRSAREKLKKKDPRFSLRKLAARIGVKPSYLSRVERGEAFALSEEKTIALAEEIGVNPDVLLALSGKISSDVQEVIRKRPELFAELVRKFKDLPDRAVLAGKEYRLVESRLNEAQRIAKIGNWEIDLPALDMAEALKGRERGVYRSDELFGILDAEVGDPRVHPEYVIENLVPEEERQALRREYYERFPETGHIDYTFRFRSFAGAFKYGRLHGLVEYDENGRPIKVRGTLQDVTDQHEAQDALRRSEERYRAVVEDQTEVISRFKADGAFLFVNDVYCRFFGKSREELMNGKWQPVAVPEDLPHIESQLEKLTPDNPVVVIENRVYSGTGEVRWMQFVNRAFFDHDGRLLEYQSVGRDITEKKAIEAELKEREQKYRLLAENVSDVITLTDSELNDVFVSPSIKRLLGYEPEEFLRLPRERVLSEKSAALLNASVDRLKGVWASGEKMRPGYKMELEFIRKDGSNVPVEMSSTPLFKNGVFSGMLSTVRDVSDRKAAEWRYRVTDIKLAGVLDHSPSVIQMKDPDGRYLLVNRRYEELFGVTPDQLIGKTPYDMHPESQAGRMLADDRKVLETGRAVTVEETVPTVRGDVTFLTTKFPLMDDENRIYAVCGISTDITERKEAERRLRESDEYHSRVFDTVDDMILVYELDGRLLDVNMAVCRLLGYSRKEMLAMNKKEIMLRKHAGEFGARIEKLVARGRLYFEAEYLSREGRAVPVEVNARTMWRSGRRLIISVARDMSRRRSFERERNRLITAVEQAAESIIVTDARGHILYVNPAFERITGYSRAEITAKHMNVLGWGAGPAERRAIPDTLSKGGVWSGKLVNRRKDGGEIEVEASISPVRDENGGITNYVAVGRDTTYESGLERQLLQVQKMEAVGTLAGGIAHDLNNNLLPIIVNVEMVKDRMREKPDLQGRLADALASARRARDLVRQILDFSRRSESGRQVIDLGLAVKEVLKMVRASAPENIRVRRRFPNDLFPVSANPSQLHQVVLNLLTNAVQAMEPDGGLLEVRITTGGGEDADPPHPEMKPGPYVALTVTDQGSGVEEKNLDRIFEPFFTTKKPGRGTGLGLSVAHGIVASHGGAMTVKSESGKGSEFTVYLPAAEDRTGETLSVAAKTALR